MTRYRKEKYVEQRELKGKWQFRVRIRGVCDKTFTEVEYGSPKRAFDTAVIYRDERLKDRRLNLITEDTNKSVRDVLLESFDIMPVRENSKLTYLGCFDTHLKDFNKPIKQLSKIDIMMSLNKNLDKGQSIIDVIMLVWRKIVKTAIIQNYIVKDITLGISTPRSTKHCEKKNVITTREEVDRVVQTIGTKTRKQKSIGMSLYFMYFLGLRPCECFALTRSDIKDGFVSINKELGSAITDSDDFRDSSKVGVVRTCKTNASIRIIPMPQELIEMFKTYETGEELLFPNTNGGYLSTSEVGGVLRGKGIKNFNMYMLRHTLASDLVKSSVDDRTIIELLGHTNISMSLYYARSDDDRKKNALNNR